ncbi:ABC transporter substrate-binding protein [Paenibacillus sp. 1P07SE]|uniref:ABC transporter substrate-binding protein n=1 Tax=Paenibacillus sp. 1P07SE TaxID=3132209 RepID=UPI0039A55BFC
MKPIWLAVPVLLASLLTAGCSSSAGPDRLLVPGASTTVLTDFAERQIVLDATPSSIVALGNGETDIIYALGGTLTGRPTTDRPPSDPAAAAVPQIGSTHEVDLERITLLRPDIVLGHHPMNTKDIPVLEGIGAQVVLTSANSIADIQRQIALLGQLIDQETRARELIAEIDAAAASYNDQLADAERPRALLVYGAPGTFMAALPNSLSGNILETAGGINIASDYPRLQSYPQYAQLSSERIVQANPDYIFILTHGKPDEVEASFHQEMKVNSAWNRINAVIHERIEVLPADLFGTNPGTRIVEALALMHEKLGLASS